MISEIRIEIIEEFQMRSMQWRIGLECSKMIRQEATMRIERDLTGTPMKLVMPADNLRTLNSSSQTSKLMPVYMKQILKKEVC